MCTGPGAGARLRNCSAAAQSLSNPTEVDASTFPGAVVRFNGITHTYRGLFRPVRAVQDFTLALNPGEVVGLAGPNGAGKSTLIALLLGYLRPTSGTLSIGGLSPRRYIETHGLGYLSELVYIPPRWRTEHALVRYALLAGVAPDAVGARVNELISLLGLDEHRSKRIRQLSKGNLQRVGLAQAMLNDERVLVLDEPTHGLDPVWTQRFREIVLSLRRPDRVILIASHNLDELQRVADRVAIIDHGRLQRVVSTRAPETSRATAVRLIMARGAELVTEFFPGATTVADSEFLLADITVEELNAKLALLLARGALLKSVTPAHSELEQQFRDAVGS